MLCQDRFVKFCCTFSLIVTPLTLEPLTQISNSYPRLTSNCRAVYIRGSTALGGGHALDLTTGAEKLGGPVVIAGPNFNSYIHLQRPALLLSGGQQKLVALGRALAIGTKCLLLDEPFEGIAPALSERLSEVLASLKGKDLTLLMSQSDLNHSRGLIDMEFTIERGANPLPASQ